jgi:hypothetical protein
VRAIFARMSTLGDEFMLKDRIVSELLAHREFGATKTTDGDYKLESLVKLEVISFLEGMKAGFLENCFADVAEAATLDSILRIFDGYHATSDVA